MIRSIFIRLGDAADDTYDAQLAAINAATFSNTLYGNHIMSSFELARGFSLPIVPNQLVHAVPTDIVRARDELQAR